jgi:putative Mg2+ transporter-C (MgtC) family protein
MSIAIDWPEIALRLALAILAGALLGIDRSERGMTAGLRTTMLVCLAAAVSMIQVNLLLDTVGKHPDSFAVLDLMRLPLGILTGMGFIGAGAILRRGNRVSGVTTAATLWMATVLGLCFGGGQHGLGLASLALGMVILGLLKHLESRIPQEERGSLTLSLLENAPSDDEIRTLLESDGTRVSSWDTSFSRAKGVVRRQVHCELNWRRRPNASAVPGFFKQLAEMPGVRSVRWRSEGSVVAR